MQDGHLQYVAPCFLLGLAVAPRVFNSRIATDHKSMIWIFGRTERG